MAENVNILIELKELGAEKLSQLERTNLYAFPKDYFSDLTENTMRNIWFQSFTPVMPYSIPSNYFENLPGLLLDKLTLSFNNNFSKQLYKVPENYFNNLAANILERIKKHNSVNEELKEISPLLSSIAKTNVYTLPSGYFEDATFSAPKRSSEPAKVVSLAGKTRKWFAYAAAACIAAIMIMGGYFYSENKSSINITGKTFATINVQKAVSELSDSTINNYLQSDNSDAYTNSNSDNEDLNIQTLIQNTSDEAIENYLIENPEPANDSKGI